MDPATEQALIVLLYFVLGIVLVHFSSFDFDDEESVDLSTAVAEGLNVAEEDSAEAEKD